MLSRDLIIGIRISKGSMQSFTKLPYLNCTQNLKFQAYYFIFHVQFENRCPIDWLVLCVIDQPISPLTKWPIGWSNYFFLLKDVVSSILSLIFSFRRIWSEQSRSSTNCRMYLDIVSRFWSCWSVLSIIQCKFMILCKTMSID